MLATSNTDLAQVIILYYPGYLAEYPYGVPGFTYSKTLFDASALLEAKWEILDKYDVNYIVTLNPQEEKQYLDYPEIFTKVFENNFSYQLENKKTGIYQRKVQLKIFEYSSKAILE